MTIAINSIIGGVLSALLLGFGLGFVFRATVRFIEGLTNSLD